MEELSKEKVFITGINGFTGAHLEQYLLDKGFDVYGTTVSTPNNPKHYCCNILDKKELGNILKSIKPKYIVHLAAISFVASENKQQIYNVNIFGTLNLLEAIDNLDYSPNKILIASSGAVYGNIEGELDETMNPQPVNHYGNSKLVMENMIKTYFETQNIIITRPFNYTGIGQDSKFLIPKIVSHFQEKKKEIELGNINVYREFNSVNFVVKCYIDLLVSDVKSEIVNVCSGSAIDIKEILDIMEDIAGYSITVKINPEFVRKNEIQTLKGSNKKLTSFIGNNNNHNSIKNTLEKMYSY